MQVLETDFTYFLALGKRDGWLGPMSREKGVALVTESNKFQSSCFFLSWSGTSSPSFKK